VEGATSDLERKSQIRQRSREEPEGAVGRAAVDDLDDDLQVVLGKERLRKTPAAVAAQRTVGLPSARIELTSVRGSPCFLTAQVCPPSSLRRKYPRYLEA